MAQYTLGLSLPPVYSPDNFVVSGCNREAWERIEAWPEWSGKTLFVYGPAGSGKSHLGRIWAQKSAAGIVDLTKEKLPAPDAIEGPMLIEHIERIENETALLHILNYSKEHGYFLLLTSTLPPAGLAFTLPDLTSRLKALPVAAIAAPDDEALKGVLRKQFSDRQIKISDEAIDYLLPRIERSFAEAAKLVALLDGKALEQKKALTIPFLKRALGLS